MTVKIAAVTTTNNTTTGTQDLTVSGFGTPDAAMFLTTFSDAAAGTLDGQACLSVGFTDGTNECVASISDRNNRSTSDSYKRQATDEVYLRLAPASGNARAEANFSTWVTDGVQVNWGSADSQAKHVTAILFSADHASSDFYSGQGTAGNGDGTAVNFTGLGAEADFVILASIHSSAADTAEANAALSIGVWINDGSDTQHSVNWFSLDNLGTTQLLSYLDTSYSIASNQTTSVGAGHDISAHASGFTVTTRERNSDSTGLTFNYLCGKWGDNVEQSIGTFPVPVLTGTSATTGVGFTPTHMFSIMSMLSSTDTWTTDQSACALGVGFSDGISEDCMSISCEDGVGTTDADSLMDDDFYSAAEGSSRTVQTGSVSSFDADGFTLSWATSPLSTAGNAVYWALKLTEPVSSGVIGTATVTAQIGAKVHGSASVAGTSTASGSVVNSTLTGAPIVAVAATATIARAKLIARVGPGQMALSTVTGSDSVELSSTSTYGVTLTSPDSERTQASA